MYVVWGVGVFLFIDKRIDVVFVMVIRLSFFVMVRVLFELLDVFFVVFVLMVFLVM